MTTRRLAVMDSDLTAGLRVCNHCREEKPLDLFVKVKRGLHGRNHTCKACHSAKQNARYHATKVPVQDRRLANMTPEELAVRAEYQRQRAQLRSEAHRRRKGTPVRRKGRDPEKLAAARERKNAKRRTGPRTDGMPREVRLARRRANVVEKAKNAEYMRAKRAANPEAVRAVERERRRQWYAANLAKARAKGSRDAHRRRARLAGCDVRIVTQHDLDRQARRQRHGCWWCGDVRPLTIEHVIPIAKGGRHAVGNIVMACESCNKGRCDRLPVAWRLELLARDLESMAA